MFFDVHSEPSTKLAFFLQLCDPSLDVCHMAVRALDEACSHKKNLDLLIRLKPNLDHLGDAGNPLLLRFLSTSKGFKHLHDMSYIDGEMDEWSMVRPRLDRSRIAVEKEDFRTLTNLFPVLPFNSLQTGST